MIEITERRSIRKYTDAKIPREELAELIKQASRAPSSGNYQPWRFTVVDSDEGKKALEPAMYGNENQLRTSAAMIVISIEKNWHAGARVVVMESVNAQTMSKEVGDRALESIQRELEGKGWYGKESQMMDIGFVGMNIMTLAKHYGLDTCPIGGFNAKKVKEVLNLNYSHEPVLLISLGIADDEGHPTFRLDPSLTTEFR